jgi:uncharacterized damage-inducible protein DinB
MKEFFLIFAKYNEEADKAVVSILDKLSNEDREKNRKSYYGSLSSLARHVVGGTVFFLGLFKDALPGNAAAQKAIASLSKVKLLQDKQLTEAQWKKTAANFKIADKAYVDFAAAISDKDLEAPVKINWFKGRSEVPLSFMLENLIIHGTHHRGQISQILDSLKIDNDFSGINSKFI